MKVLSVFKKILLAAVLLGATPWTAAETSPIDSQEIISGVVGVGTSNLDSLMGIQVQMTSIYDTVGVYASIGKGGAAQRGKDLQGKYTRYTYNSHLWAAGINKQYKGLLFYTGYSEGRTKFSFEGYGYTTKKYEEVLHGIDFGMLYKVSTRTWVGIGYNTASNTAQTSVGYSFN